MNGEVVVRGDKRSREDSVWSFLSSILDGPRRIPSQPEREASLLVFEDSNLALLSGVELGSGLPRILTLTGTPNVKRLP